MLRRISNLAQSLSARLLFGLLTTMGIVAGVDAVFTYRATTAEWMRRTQEEAARTSELIKHATSYGMLLNRKEDVHQTIRRIATGPGVAGIRVYDKRGMIIFSTEPAEIGNKVDVNAEACVVCHRGDPPSPAPLPAGRMRQFRRLDGHGVVGFIDPIENRAECSTAACHAHDRRQTILGVLDVRMSTDAMDAAHQRMKRQFLGSLFATVLSLALVSAMFVHRVVRRPVRALYLGTQRVAAGDLDTRIEIRGRNEVGSSRVDLQACKLEYSIVSPK